MRAVNSGELLGEVIGVRPLHDEDDVGAAQRVPRGEARLVCEAVTPSVGEETARSGWHLVPGLRRDPARIHVQIEAAHLGPVPQKMLGHGRAAGVAGADETMRRGRLDPGMGGLRFVLLFYPIARETQARC